MSAWLAAHRRYFARQASREGFDRRRDPYRAKIHLKFSALLTIPDVHFAGPLRSDFGSLEKRADTVWCAGSPLALLAMARRNECGLAGGFDPQ